MILYFIISVLISCCVLNVNVCMRVWDKAVGVDVAHG